MKTNLARNVEQSVSEIAHRVSLGLQAFDEFERMKQPRAETPSSISVAISTRGRQEMRSVERLWRVSGSALIRLALWRMFTDFGFPASGILEEQDCAALNRSPRAPKPFTTAEEAGKRRRNSLVFAEHHGGDDPPQP